MKDPEKVIKKWYYITERYQQRNVAKRDSTSNKIRKIVYNDLINECGAVLVALRKIYLEIYDKEI